MPDGICPFTDWKPVTPFGPGGRDKVGFCDHTAGGFYSTLSDPGFWNPKGISVHFAVARDGRACQLVNIFDRAYAQGRDSRPPDASHPNGYPVGPTSPGITWPPFAAMGKSNPNEYLISTEHEDAVTVNGQTVFVPGSQWTEEQYAIDLRIKQWCAEEFQRVRGIELMQFGFDSFAGHHMFDPVNRAECPGRFWRNEYRERLWNDLRGEDMFTIWSHGGNPEITGLVEGVNVGHIRQLLGLPAEFSDWDLEFSVIGDAIIYHGIPAEDNRRAGRIRGNDSLVRVRLSNNTGDCYVQCLTPTTRVWVAARGYHTPPATW